MSITNKNFIIIIIRKITLHKNLDLLFKIRLWNTTRNLIVYDTIRTRRRIVEVILLNFQSNLGHMDKLEVI